MICVSFCISAQMFERTPPFALWTASRRVSCLMMAAVGGLPPTKHPAVSIQSGQPSTILYFYVITSRANIYRTGLDDD